jgi:hypothetical protein
MNNAHKRVSIMMKKTTARGAFKAIIGAALLAGIVQAAPPPPNLRALENKEKKIGRSITDRDAALERIVEEFRRNRIVRGEIGAFRGYSAVLRGLNENELRQAIKNLRDADGQRALISQGAIAQKLDAIYLDWQRRNALLRLSAAFRILAGEQRQNMAKTRAIANGTANLANAQEKEFALSSRLLRQRDLVEQTRRLSDALVIYLDEHPDMAQQPKIRAARELAVGGQSPLAAFYIVSATVDSKENNAKAVIPVREYFNHTTAGHAEAELFIRENKSEKNPITWAVRSSQTASGLGIGAPSVESTFMGAVSEAATALQRKQTMGATSTQERAFRTMRVIAFLLDPSDTKEKLKRALGDLNQAINKQEQVAAKSKALEDPKKDTRKLEFEQADVVLDTDLIKQDLQNLVPEATENLDQAIDNQQQAREALKENGVDPKAKGETAAAEQKKALEKMEAAKEAIQNELEELEKKENQPPKNSIKTLEELKKKVGELKEAEEKIKNEAAKAEQAPEPSAEQKQAAEQAEQAAKKAAEQARELAEQAAQAQPPTNDDEAEQLARQIAEAIRKLDAEVLAEIEKKANEAEGAKDLTEARQALRDAFKETAEAVAAKDNNSEQLAEAAKPLEAAAKKLAEAAKKDEQAAKKAATPEQKQAAEAAKKAAEQAAQQAENLAQLAKGELPEGLAEQIAEAAKELAGKDLPEAEKKANEAKVESAEALKQARQALEEAAKQAAEAAKNAEQQKNELAEAAKPLEQAAKKLAEAAEKAAEAAKKTDVPK